MAAKGARCSRTTIHPLPSLNKKKNTWEKDLDKKKLEAASTSPFHVHPPLSHCPLISVFLTLRFSHSRLSHPGDNMRYPVFPVKMGVAGLGEDLEIPSWFRRGH